MSLSILTIDTLDELEYSYKELVKVLKDNETQNILKRIAAGEKYLERTDLTQEQRLKAESTYYALVQSIPEQEDVA